MFHHITHKNSPHDKTFKLEDAKLIIIIKHPDKECVKGTLHWLPPMTKMQMAKRLLVFLMGDEQASFSSGKSSR